MKSSVKSKPVGIRVSSDIKKRFDEYCEKRGLKKSFLLSKIIEEKISEFEENEMDLELAEERTGEKSISLEEFNRNIDGRV